MIGKGRPEVLKASLLKLVTDAEFGQVRLGMSDADVRPILGPPGQVGGKSRKYREGNLWRYGDLELGFDPSTRLLEHIALSFWAEGKEHPSAGANIELDCWLIRPGIRETRLIAALRDLGVGCSALTPRNADTNEYRVGQHAVLLFEKDPNGQDDPLLVKIVVS